MTGAPLLVERWHGSAAALHALAVPGPEELVAPRAWWLEVAGPALVLGSAQGSEVVDDAAAAERGVEVARRRSGGGAVLLGDGATWIDVLLPRADPRWDDDVVRSSDWLGRGWCRALGELGVEGATAHVGPLQRTPWSSLVCFAGVGPGEVLVGGRKVVGISQRRTRHHARFQCAVLHRWDPAEILELLQLDAADRRSATTALGEVAVGLDDLVGRAVGAAEVVGALRAALDAA